jgi:hypothetical protein
MEQKNLSNKNLRSLPTLRQAEKIIFDVKFKEAILTLDGFLELFDSKKSKAAEELYKAAVELHTARKYIEHYTSNKKNSMIVEQIREGYIGKKVVTLDGTEFVQTTRGKPIGTLVAIGKDNWGFTYIGKDEKYIDSIIGTYIALKRILEGEKEPKIRTETAGQIQHFVERTYRCFDKNHYSLKCGTDPIKDTNYEERAPWLLFTEAMKTKDSKILDKIKKIFKSKD